MIGRTSNTVVARVGLDDKGFQNGVQKIQRSLKVVKSEFAAASTKLGEFGKSTDKLKLKSDSLAKQMDLQKKKVELLTKSYEDSVEKKGADAKSSENLRIKLNYAIRDMNKMEKEITETNKQLKIQSSSFTVLGKKLDAVGGKMKRIGEGFSKVGRGLSTKVTAPIIAAGAGLLKLSDQFEKAENTIRIGTGATGETLQELNEDFKSVYTAFNSSMEDASTAVADLNTRTGLSGGSLQELSLQMLKLSKITKEDINTLIPATTRMFQDAGISTENYSEALDYTFKVSQNTGIGVVRLQQLMTQFGGPLRQMGFDWKTSAAMLGKFEKEGVNTELVLGSLRIALGKMAKEGISEPNKALKELISKIKEAGSAGEANSIALEMFGSRAGPDMAAAIREGRLDLESLIDVIKNSPETIDKASKDTMTVADKFTVLKNKMAVSLEPVGKKLLDAVEGAMPSIEKFLGKISKLIEKFNNLSPAQQKIIFKLTLLVAALGPVLSIIGKITTTGGMIISLAGKASTAIGTLSGATGILGKVFTALTGPIGIIIGIVGSLIIVFIKLYKHNEKFRTKVNEICESVKITVMGFISGIKNVINTFFQFTKKLWNKYGKRITKAVGSVLGEIFKIIGKIIESIKRVVGGGWRGIKNITSKVWNGIKSAIINPITAVKNRVKKVVDAIGGFFKNLRIPKIKIPKIKLPHFKIKGGFSLSPPQIPKLSVNWYAKGGIFNSPNVIGVGEAGTEAVLPIDRLDDLIAGALKKVGGMSGGGITLKIEKFINNSDKDIEQLAYELEFYRKRVSMGRGGI